MKNFGFGDLYLVAPRCRLDARAEALASHAVDVLERATVTETLEEALAGCRFAAGTTARGRASSGNTVLDARAGIAQLPAEGAALVFGPEDTGLNNAELDRCQAFITIPTAEYASINLAQAVNVLCYEWFQQQAEGTEDRPEPAGADRAQLEGMYAQLMDLLLHIGYTDAHRSGTAEHIMRRVFDRAALSAHEVAAIRGIWRQARWAADSEPSELPGNRGTAEDPA